MAKKTARRQYQMFRSPGYEKTIRQSRCQTWASPAAIAQQLWPQCVFESERTGDWYLQRYNFPFLVIELMLDGELVYDVGGKSVLSCGGDIHITPPGSDIRVSSTESRHCRRIGLELRGQLVPTLAQSLRLNRPLNLHFSAFDGVEANLRTIFMMLEKKQAETEAAVSSCCYDTLVRIAAELDTMSKPAVAQTLQKLLDHLHANLHQPLSCETLAQMASCSPSTLTRMFRTQLQQTPQAYVARCRLQQARQLLLVQELSVKQVAAMLGYRNQFYFSRAFKREFGIPPTELRRGC